MTAGKLTLIGLTSLALAVGASGTAAARSSYSFGFSTGPAWGGYAAYPAAYPVYPAYPAYYRPAPVYAYPYPAYPAYSYGPNFSFSYHGR